MDNNELNELKIKHQNGEQIQALIQFYIGNPPHWIDIPNPMWRGGLEYRVKPTQIK